MPKTSRSGEPIKEELPGTIRRSPKKAQDTFAKAHDSAAEQYGDEERGASPRRSAPRTAPRSVPRRRSS